MDNESVEKIGIIIAIENYVKPPTGRSLPNVKYAKNDAKAIEDIFLNTFSIPPSNIYKYIDEKASKTTLENDIPYIIQGLNENFILYIYYVGHGYYSGDSNRVSAYDTNLFNLNNTSIPLDTIVFTPLSKSTCKRCIFFLDTCSEMLKEDLTSRGLIDTLSYDDFKKFISSNNFMSIFISSSPGEKSYSSDSLKNGIWTWHLVRALKGEEKNAMDRDNSITNISLQEYLSHIVPKFITMKKEIMATQNPFSIFHSSNRFSLIELDKEDDEIDKVNICLDLENIKIIRHDTTPIYKADWFDKRKGHFISDSYNQRTSSFIREKENQNIVDEIQEVYLQTKDILNLKKQQIEKNVSQDGGYVDTEFFRYQVFVDQEERNPDRFEYYRILKLRKDRNKYNTAFDNIFPYSFHKIIFPFSGKLNFDDMVDKLEDYKISNGGKLNDNENENIIDYIFSNGLLLNINFNNNEISFNSESARGCISLIDEFSKQINEIGYINKLLFYNEE